MLATVTSDCDNILAFLQAVAVNSPWIIVAPLSLCTDKHVRFWFCRLAGNNLPHTTNAPQDHRGLMGVLSDIVTQIQHAKALCRVVGAQRKAYKETKVWDCLPPTETRVILAESASNGTSIPTSPPPTIYRLLNASNTTALQADCALNYAGHNIHLPTSF